MGSQHGQRVGVQDGPASTWCRCLIIVRERITRGTKIELPRPYDKEQPSAQQWTDVSASQAQTTPKESNDSLLGTTTYKQQCNLAATGPLSSCFEMGCGP